MVVPTGAVVFGRADSPLAFEVTSLRNEVGPIGRESV
jgi:hypothetical protein